MKLKHPWSDFFVLVAITSFGIIGVQRSGPFPPLWWAMALSGGAGLLWFAWDQGGEEKPILPEDETGGQK